MNFDLALGYPQWQGSGRHEDLIRGAEETSAVCARFAPLVSLKASEASADGHGVRFWGAILDHFQQAQKLLARHVPRRLLTAAGDCSVDVASIDYLFRLYPDLTVIWVDTHRDANTPQSSPSGNLHGMPVSIVMGHAPVPMRVLMGKPLNPDHFRYVGARFGDDGDRAFVSANRLRDLGADESLSGPVHVHFDLDVFNPSEFPYLAYG